jgi:hypothetical protein
MNKEAFLRGCAEKIADVMQGTNLVAPSHPGKNKPVTVGEISPNYNTTAPMLLTGHDLGKPKVPTA